jgi:hypothetical protein
VLFYNSEVHGKESNHREHGISFPLAGEGRVRGISDPVENIEQLVEPT